ncbi:intraflagellar transport protein 46 homolog isoform X2 [Zeugodacus cucurbitae]|uniref:intraflagellar transport protein 46 homolog isoform X2 n=1 Tax=Zeugodacus cucurbitae TaxID=28588 RepID=UPI0023D8FA35|nr:intraflagellar transport protein 46 homolog isoform X2 [Zeugodacus cucurbitae]
MNYYDEEISINGPDSKNLSHFNMDRMPSNGSGRDISGTSAQRLAAASTNRTATLRQRNILHGSSTDDDGLLQDIIDHDDEDDDEDDDDESEMQPRIMDASRGIANQRPQTRPGSARSTANVLSAKPLKRGGGLIVPSESESDEAASPQPQIEIVGDSAAVQSSPQEQQLSIKPEDWQNLTVHQELKDLFPHILKYTPQSIDTPYRLQPFIPDFVPSVGDVDAFLKVTIPPLSKPQRQQEVNEYLHKMGIYLLDEPSGEQSEPSLLNMKLRSVLTGSGAKARSASATIIPTAKTPKEIDKWINEVEKLHMTQMVNDIQPRKEIEPLLMNWPRSYADASDAVQQAYQRCLEDDDIARYVRTLCQQFEVQGPAETQIDYIMNVQTLFALYLAANQAWE